ncbi:MAG: TraR/DksA C4-type zinc finger protein [Candidatus Uhrbacteria bacterium]
MNDQFLQNIKETLLKDQVRLINELSKTDFEDVGDEEGENAYEVAQYTDKLSLEDTLKKALRDVEDSLARIEQGTYGTCKYCHEEIDEQRIEARPTSSACIKCKKTLTQEV